MKKSRKELTNENAELKKYLNNNEAIWQFALESFGDGMWDCDVKEGKISYSKNCMHVTGYDNEGTRGNMEEWMSSIHPDDLMRVKSNLAAHLEGQLPVFKCEYRILCKDGNYRWLLDRGKVISYDEQGKPERMVGICIDLSLQKKLEKSLKSSLQKERELNKLKSQFVSMASHEFRTPLATMLMTTESLLAYYDRMSKEDIFKKARTIKQNIKFLKKVIEKTLSLAQLESGSINISPVDLELNEFLKEVKAEALDSAGCQHEIIFQGSETPVNIVTDRQILKEVMQNLLANSMKYSEPEKPVEMELKNSGDHVTIKVTDKGIGIPEKDKKAVFEAYRRGSNVGGIRGTGLGLTLARQFIRAEGGDVKFKSEVNRGSTFFVTLPI